jgi:hypothetical protein
MTKYVGGKPQPDTVKIPPKEATPAPVPKKAPPQRPGRKPGK